MHMLFEYEPVRHFCISIARSSYLVYNLRLSQTTKKTAEKIDTNAQWFHCSWSILLKRVNIRVRGFHLVLLFVNLATYLCEDFRIAFATTVFAFTEHVGKQELSQLFRGESGGVYLKYRGVLFVHCKAKRRRHQPGKNGNVWKCLKYIQERWADLTCTPRVLLTTYGLACCRIRGRHQYLQTQDSGPHKHTWKSLYDRFNWNLFWITPTFSTFQHDMRRFTWSPHLVAKAMHATVKTLRLRTGDATS